MAAPSAGRTGRRSTSHHAAPGVAASERIGWLEIACWLQLGVATILGGLSFFSLRDDVLAVLAVPTFLLALWPRRHLRTNAATRTRIGLALILGALPLLYLLPLPLDMAAHLPGRAARLQAAIVELGGDRWTTVSLAADDTWQAWLKLMPALALFLAALRLSSAQRHRLLGVMVGIGLLQALWGLAQMYGGPDTALRLYGADEAYQASGGFANRNHFASLLLLCLPQLALLASAGGWSWHAPTAPHSGVRLLGALGMLLIAVALLASRSRAAAVLLLLEVALFCVWLLRQRRASTWLLAGGSAIALCFVAILPFASYRLFGGFELGNADGRLGVLRRSLAAAWEFFPLGAGPGTFGSVFPSFDTLATLDKVYINRAHNDALELAFELGAVGLALYLAALATLAAAFWHHIARRRIGGDDGVHWACTLGLFAVLVHGAVDYPMRVPLVAMVALTFLAVLLAPKSASSSSSPRTESPRDARVRAAAAKRNADSQEAIA